MNEIIWTTLYGGVALQGVFVASILLFTKKGNSHANKILSLLILVFSCTRFQAVVNISEAYRQWPHLIAVTTPLWFVLAPLYYFYVKSLLSQPVRWTRFSIIHALPALVILLHISRFYILTAEIKLSLVDNQTTMGDSGLRQLFYILLYGGQNLVYLGICIRILSRANTRNTPVARSAHVQWLKLLFILMVLYGFFDILMAVLRFLNGRSPVAMEYFPMAVYTGLVYTIAYLGIQQPEKLFPPKLRIKKKAAILDASHLAAGQIISRLHEIMETEKLYIDTDLKYSHLAARLGISVRALSRILNEELGQNFNDFVNAYRVEEVKKQLLNKANGQHTLLAIALDAGFNSKTSFNRIFRNHTGMTPTEFVRRQKIHTAQI